MAPTVTRRSALALVGLAGLSVAGCGSPNRGPKPQRVAYGPDVSQFGDLHLPTSTGHRLPVVVVIHGGYWGSGYGLSLGTPLAADLARHGVAAWNIEYRRLGNGGGWPATFADVADAMDALRTKGNAAADGRLDLTKVVTLGHSAGGQLAAWLAARHKLASGQVGAAPAVRPIGYVSQAGVLDLADGYDAGLGDGAVAALMGGSPTAQSKRFAVGSPYELLPLEIPGTMVHGLADSTVPIRQSDRFAAKAKQVGDHVTEVRLPGVDHFMLIDPSTTAWAQCREAVLGYLGLPG